MRDAKSMIIAVPAGNSTAIPITVIERSGWQKFKTSRPKSVAAWASAQGFEAAALSLLLVPDSKGNLAEVFVGAPGINDDAFALGAISSRLPPGQYCFASALKDPNSVGLGWCLELYKYDPHRPISPKNIILEAPANSDAKRIAALANAVAMVRDLVNAPANVMGPQELENAARRVAKTGKAKLKVISGKALEQGFPLIHTVGAASTRPPRLLDMSWGSTRDPKVTIVGKGVCFDTGGLDIKPSAGMLLMKKDMGGAANILGLAQLIMAAKLKLRLRVLIPAVENSIAGAAFRPGDVFKSRKGLTVEIGNTDAEGRLVLADALALADEEKPELLLDMATLTGAARVALGPDLPPLFTNDDQLAADLQRHGTTVNDPLWRLPLWQPYNAMIDTPIADINNSGAGGFAGSITAALFLQRFVEHAKSYVHFDIFAWVPTAKPGRPKGGESQAMRAVFALLEERYGK